MLRAEQVGPADRADEQGAAGEQQGRIRAAAGVGDGIGDVLGRMAGRVEGCEPQRPDVERLAVADRSVLVARARRRRR